MALGFVKKKAQKYSEICLSIMTGQDLVAL